MNEREMSGKVNHILYADDTLVFCDAEESQVRYLLAGLICFECISGLKINIHKSTMFAVGEVVNASYLAEVFGCELGTLPACYLGLPLGDRVSSGSIWTPVVERVERRLGSWKAKWLSSGAHLTLIKSVLASLPTYHLSLLKAPTRVICSLERIQRRFLWEGNAEGRRIHWVDWLTVKTSTDKGGLGIIDIKTFNKALLGKWIWRYATERCSWWRKLIVSKFGVGSSEWYPKTELGASSFSVWMRIAQLSSIVWRFAYIDPGGGFCSFWSDYWAMVVRLSDHFPRIKAADARFPGGYVFNYLSSNRSSWDIPLRFNLRGGASLEFQLLLSHLDALLTSLISEGPDSVAWPAEKNQIFTVRSFRRLMYVDRFPGASLFPSVVVWSRCAPAKVQFFCWVAYRNSIATTDNLQRRGFILPNRCVLCERQNRWITCFCIAPSRLRFGLSSVLPFPFMVRCPRLLRVSS
ncbi:Putative ribonuclease H protein At1g65750 [Linum perenne]